jgi:hypothetical protein
MASFCCRLVCGGSIGRKHWIVVALDTPLRRLWLDSLLQMRKLNVKESWQSLLASFWARKGDVSSPLVEEIDNVHTIVGFFLR